MTDEHWGMRGRGAGWKSRTNTKSVLGTGHWALAGRRGAVAGVRGAPMGGKVTHSRPLMRKVYPKKKKNI